MQIISLSGLDGSGKSTQINLLKEFLEAQGKRVAYFHAVQFSIANLPHLQTSIHHNQTDTGKSVTKASWLQIQLRKLALAIDLMRFKKYIKKLERENYDYLLSDRYFYDTLINIAYLQSKTQLSTCDVRRATHIPKPDHAFYLNTDPEKIMQRDRAPEQGLAYLEAKKQLLDNFAEQNNLLIIDGNRDKQAIFAQIKEKTRL